METSMPQTNYMVDGYNLSKDSSSDEIIHIPYNINNLLATEENILEILENNNVKIDKINHLHFFHQAFTHKSYIEKDIFPEHVLISAKKELGNPKNLLELQKASYERLEYFGDRVVKILMTNKPSHGPRPKVILNANQRMYQDQMLNNSLIKCLF